MIDSFEQERLIKEMQKMKKSLEKAMKVFSNKLVITKTLQINGPGKIRLRNLSGDPTSGEVGELVVVAGELKICTVASATSPTWTVVGTQT